MSFERIDIKVTLGGQMIKWLLRIQFGLYVYVGHVSVWICLGHNLYICSWISK